MFYILGHTCVCISIKEQIIRYSWVTNHIHRLSYKLHWLPVLGESVQFPDRVTLVTKPLSIQYLMLCLTYVFVTWVTFVIVWVTKNGLSFSLGLYLGIEPCPQLISCGVIHLEPVSAELHLINLNVALIGYQIKISGQFVENISFPLFILAKK